jgi:hypothetical protein
MSVLDASMSAVYAAGMALVFGGTAALSFASAPATFRTIKAVDAGRVFGKTLRIFDTMAFWASIAALIAAIVDAASSGEAGAIARAVLAGTVAALLALARRVLTPRMAALKPPTTEDEDRQWDPANRAAFNRLHGQYVRVYSANLFLALAAITVQAMSG